MTTQAQVQIPIAVPSLTPHPSEYGIPHDSWRQYQFETVQWIGGQEGVLLSESVTGSGKSVHAIAQAHSPTNPRRTVILTRTKSLQLQYKRDYSAHLLMGKANYPCVHGDALPYDTAEDCLHAETKMQDCKLYTTLCPYALAKEKALNRYTMSVCTNYAYWLTSPRFRKSHIDLLVLDECQLLDDITIQRAGCTINDNTRSYWRLPYFPRETSTWDALSWLSEARDILGKQWQALQGSKDPLEKKEARKCERLGFKIKATVEAIETCSEAWFIRSGPTVCFAAGGTLPGIIIKPLTAKYHFPHLFLNDSPTTLLMSATIGSFDAYTRVMGIQDYHGRKVPSRFPPRSRPIHILDVPKLSHNSKEGDYTQQADEIAGAILDLDPTWSGIIHVTRKNEAPILADRLAHRGLQDRVYIPPQKNSRGMHLGTQQQVELWNQHRDTHIGAIVVAWQFHEGYDGVEEKINITAKVQFPSLSSEYEQQRMKYSRRMYNLRTAWALMQSQGRNRRGRDEDYDTELEIRGYNAIADGNWSRVKGSLSEDFLECLVEG